LSRGRLPIQNRPALSGARGASWRVAAMDWKGLSPHDLDMPGERNVAAMYAVTYARALPYTVLFVLLWGVYFLVLRSCLGAEICKIRTGTWALKLMMLTHHSVITPLALLSMWEDPVIRR
ncbi:unnamed protein product, partial [Effrenium voratum]